MRITKEEVGAIATLARLKLTDTEQDELVAHFDKILTYVDKLDELDTDGVEPTAHAIEVSAPLREDRVTNHSESDALLANAPSRKTNFFRVPRIIE